MMVLLIENDDLMINFVKTLFALEEQPLGLIQIKDAKTLKDGMKIIDKERPDYIILDLNLPDSRGLETAQTISSISGEIPTVVLSGAKWAELGIKKMGFDFLLKTPENLQRLPIRVIKYAMAHVSGPIKKKQIWQRVE